MGTCLNMGIKHTERFILLIVIALFWIMSITIWWATLWHADAFVEFGGDLPAWTTLVIESTKLSVPFVMAGLFSAITLFTIFQQRQYALLVSCSMLCIAVVLSLVVVIGITSPLVKLCGEFVPGWTSAIESTGGNATSDAIARNTDSNECRN